MSPKSSKVVPGRYPPKGESRIADAIRERRGPGRDLSPLDGTLLHVPPIADGWNSLLGAVRTKGNLSGDVREIMILRVAALNSAAFEWIHHEPVARSHGLTTAQLYVVRDTSTPLPPSAGILSPLQTSALLFADASTKNVIVPPPVIDALKRDLRAWVQAQDAEEGKVEEKVDDLYVEAAAVTAAYNMVSRFLMATDVAGMSEDQVPWPVERKDHFVDIPSENGEPGHTIHAITLVTDPTAPWVVFANSLLTDLSMWSYVVPYFIGSNAGQGFNILLHSQRGHGQSNLPSSQPPCTIPKLASDIHALLSQLNIPTPVHSVIGVSQGGAAALAFATMYGSKGAKSLVVCDTAPKTPEGNQKAWEERIELVYGGTAANGDSPQAEGMSRLAQATIPRWFPENSGASDRARRLEWIAEMIKNTKVKGFEAGARALGSYDLFSLQGQGHGVLFSDVPHVLLIAGSLDGGGKVGQGLKTFAENWNAKREELHFNPVVYKSVEDAGHLPMVDRSEEWWKLVGEWIHKF